MRSPLTTMGPLLLSVALSAPTAALAEPQPAAPRAALITIAGSQAGRLWADGLATRLAASVARLDPLLPERARELLTGALDEEALRRADRQALSATQALEAFDDLPEAARRLRAAAESYLELLPLLETLDEPARLLLGLATAELALGHQEAVEQALMAISRLDPVLDLDPQETSPRLAEAAERARSETRDAPILTEAQARRLGQQLDVDALILLQPRPGPRQARVELYHSETGRRAGRWTIAGQDVTSVAAALRATPLRPAAATAQNGGDPQPETFDDGVEVFGCQEGEGCEALGAGQGEASRRPRRPVYQRWWFWTIIGALVAGGAATGVVLGLRAQGDPGDLSLEVYGHW